MVLENLVSMFGNLWDFINQLVLILIFLILTGLFFVAQYFLLKAYIWFFKTVWSFPLTQVIFNYIIEEVLNVEIKDKKYITN